ncbi:caffeoyl-CoA O-methyltransferase [Hypnocyclicus thermotrophus]|uniref:tRNA 5-hydroxyuridine methyltransferase n=1 Tax=Hypnocyclicus thermotrophus TaxID=1627895 RepID=A0AA46DXS1_9FUSO|nr:O-methyltransferase [Hypnocyclicus thermotrophus]TDT68642.1 caffeoyl-CoA O-methyltransferase [Hypnocyclicus thermotrophus]
MLEELKQANDYIYSKLNEKNTFFLELEEYAEKYNIPIITKEVKEFLRFLLSTNKYQNILEIGSAIGYSTLIMSKTLNDNCHITTLEIDKERYDIAKSNFKKSNNNNIDILLGDALDIIPTLNKKYDFIFIDAAKGQYQNFFNTSYNLLNENGLIFIDNIMFRGYLYKEYPKRFKTIVKKLDNFIDYLYQNHDFTLLPFGDGIGLVKK